MRPDAARARAGTSGLHRVRGDPADSNGTTFHDTPLENGKVHTVLLRVEPQGDRVKVLARLDGKPLVDWAGSQADLSLEEKWSWNEGQLGLATNGPEVTFKRLRARALSGELRNPE